MSKQAIREVAAVAVMRLRFVWAFVYMGGGGWLAGWLAG